MTQAALSGHLANAEFIADPIFGFAVPSEVPGVPDTVLQPRSTWSDVNAYDVQARKLAAMFRDNFEQYADRVSDDIRNAGPRS
jgi:phosphoenolpyruvate carboxykinase (ATP)